MITFKIGTITAAVVLAVQVAVQAAAPAGTAFTYQGVLKDDGNLVTDDCNFRFKLFDAEQNGNELGSFGPENVAVADGQFAVQVDFGHMYWGDARWLQIEVDCEGNNVYTVLTPRQELTPTPYASGLSLPYEAQASEPGNVVSFVNLGGGRAGNFQISNVGNTEAAVNALTNGTGPAGRFLNDATGNAVEATATGPDTTGVLAEAGEIGVSGVARDRGNTRGVYGMVTSAEGAGVFGEATAGIGSNFGVSGKSISTSGRGVAGEATATSGTTYGGHFVSHSVSGRAVFGRATATGGVNVAGEFVSHGSSGTGVRGEANNGQGNTFGGWFKSDADGGIGVQGTHTNSAGTGPGVKGITYSLETGAVAVAGIASASAGSTIGVYGESVSGLGLGVHGKGGLDGVKGEGSRHGVVGTGGAAGVVGTSQGVGGNGVLGWASDNDGAAVRGDHPGTGIAVYGISGGQGVRGEGGDFGVVGVSFDPDGVGGYFSANDGIALRTQGKAGINTDYVPDGVMLAVDGKVLCEEVEVQMSEDWPDYVFEADYDLMPLPELERVIQKQKHLPNIPSAKVVAAEGISIGKMQTATIRKVEELTLYMIEMNKQLELVRQENTALKQRLASLEAGS